MASVKDTASFFAHGNSKQFDFVLKLYPQVLRLKAEKRTKKPEELIKLDDWYQNELPRRIKQRGKDAHLVHEELVQAMKWKQSRGKFYPQLSYLIKVNTPRAVVQETKKAFRKLPNLEQALTALSNLKGVGTTMASALLAAAAPDSAPFMADECLMAIPEIEGIDYTTKEYLNFVTHIQTAVARLNSEKDINNLSWSAHRVELAMWTHYVASELAPELLEELPTGSSLVTNSSSSTTTTTTTTLAAPDSPSTTTTDTVTDGGSAAAAAANSTSSSSSTCANNTNGSSTPTQTAQLSAEESDESNLEAASSTTTNNTNSSCGSSTNDNVTTSSTAVVSAEAAAAAAAKKEAALLATVTTTTSSNPDVADNNAVVLVVRDDDDDDDDEEDEEEDEEDEEEEEEEEEVVKDSSSSGGDEQVVGTTANGKNGNGVIDSSLDESTRSEDSLEKPITPITTNNEETNTNDSDSLSSAKRSLDCESSDTPTENSEPELKKIKTQQDE